MEKKTSKANIISLSLVLKKKSSPTDTPNTTLPICCIPLYNSRKGSFYAEKMKKVLLYINTMKLRFSRLYILGLISATTP